MSEERIEPYSGPAGGWGALRSVARQLVRQRIPAKGAITLLAANQLDGFDCPGCAWPDRNHRSLRAAARFPGGQPRGVQEAADR